MERFIKISIVTVVLGAIAYFCYSLMAGWYKGNIEAAKSQERKEWQKTTATLVEKVNTLEEELTQLKGQTIPNEKLAEVFGEDPIPLPSKEQEITFAEIEHQVAAFFAYLDSKQYVKKYNLSGGTYHQYELSVKKLSAKLPIVVGETDSLYNLFLNIAHFYRVLGKKRVFLVRAILKNESEIIESVIKTFYLWHTFENETAENIKERPPFPILYEYAAYFLNTLGGRSYLLRRDSRIRILTTYYCVLIIDQANDKKLNSNGIDIRPHIELTYEDIKNQIGLIHQKQYLMKLNDLKKKYKLS
jgi:NADH:ubiquinone oxidoreductase subunit C